MSDDYLWDRSGPPDPDVVALEEALRPLQRPLPPRGTLPAWGRGAALAAAAAVIVALGGWWMAAPAPTSAPSGWALMGEAGCPDDDCLLEVGEWLEPAQAAILEVADIGFMTIDPASRLRLKATGDQQHRLELARGRISASVVAPPRLLIVETPSATAVDLGCAYTLEVDDHGLGELVVTSGQVSLEVPERQVLVPAGAMAYTRPELGPGTPRFMDAAPAFKHALDAFDVTGDPAALEDILAAARPRDSLSLWHLLPQVEPPHRRTVFQRMVALSPGIEAPEADVLRLQAATMQQLLRTVRADWARK